MFNAEKLLGGLLMGSNRRGSLNRLVSGGVGLGLLGVAMEAAEHFLKKQKADHTDGPPPAPSTDGHAAPASPPPLADSAPPPPPLEPPTIPTHPSSVETGGEKPQGPQTEADAVRLIRAMIAAANADGVIDEQERGRILKRFDALNLSDAEHTFIVGELSSPGSLDQIVSQAVSSETAAQIYSVSLMAIEIDTDAERRYMNDLARRLNIDDEKRKWIHEKLGVSPPNF